MIDLRQYYFDHITSEDYYFRFRPVFNDACITCNPFTGKEECKRIDFSVFDCDEAIARFRGLCEPGNEPADNQAKCWFYALAFYLDKNGFYIEQFPNVLSRPPLETSDFTYGDIRDWAFKHNLNEGNTVRYATRRQIVADLNFLRKDEALEVAEDMNRLFAKVSTRDAEFQQMSLDERLTGIANLIEYLLKCDGRFLRLDYQPVAFDYLDDDVVRKYRRQIQCFRHSSNEALSERVGFTEEQKKFLVDFGIVICKSIRSLLTTSAS